MEWDETAAKVKECRFQGCVRKIGGPYGWQGGSARVDSGWDKRNMLVATKNERRGGEKASQTHPAMQNVGDLKGNE